MFFPEGDRLQPRYLLFSVDHGPAAATAHPVLNSSVGRHVVNQSAEMLTTAVNKVTHFYMCIYAPVTPNSPCTTTNPQSYATTTYGTYQDSKKMLQYVCELTG